MGDLNTIFIVTNDEVKTLPQPTAEGYQAIMHNYTLYSYNA